MAVTPTIRGTQAKTLVTVGGAGGDVSVTQARTFAIFNFITEAIRVTQARGLLVVKDTEAPVRVTQSRVLAVVRGRIADPKLRAWTFTLDGHDFYVLRLGDSLTLVYDVSTEQWMDWTSRNLDFWRANIGMNWIGGQRFGPDYGSDVVVGDDAYGLLYFLDPEQPYDQVPLAATPVQESYFERITMGQVPMRGREVLPCYSTWLTTDMGNPAYTGAGVTLFTSDDGGETFDDHGLVTVTLNEFTPELSWYSLGQVGAPGRLFKIVDDGAIMRIDGLEMNDPDDAG